jgi:CubicO group peptidase (beta-lactamase class C family)
MQQTVVEECGLLGGTSQRRIKAWPSIDAMLPTRTSFWCTGETEDHRREQHLTPTVTEGSIMRFIMRVFIAAIVCFSTIVHPQAEELSETIDGLMSEFVRLDKFSGCVLVAKDGGVLYAKAFGEANKDHHVPNTLQTKFNIGSIGKTFTGVAIMQLAERGLLDVDDPVSTHLPDFPFGDQITIHHLLTHTSGTFNYFAHPEFAARMFRIRSVQDALSLIYEQELRFETPGGQFAYSNSGIVILGAVIEAVTGQEYPDYLQESILSPAGMRDTGINYWDRVVEDRASGYIRRLSGEFACNIFMVPPANADGGIETTVEDLLKFDQALRGGELLNKESKVKMFTPFLENYGYCWRIDRRHGGTVVGHGGGAPGISAEFLRFIDDGYTLVVLSNYDRAASPVSRAVEAVMFGEEYDPPRPTIAEYLYEHMREEDADRSAEAVERLITLGQYPIASSRALNDVGYALLAEGEYDMAVAVFRHNITLFPDEANPYDSLGEACLMNGDRGQAVEYYQKALEIDPTFESALRALENLQAGPDE